MLGNEKTCQYMCCFNCQFDFIVYSDRKKYLDVMKQFRLWKKVAAKQLVGYFYNIPGE